MGATIIAIPVVRPFLYWDKLIFLLNLYVVWLFLRQQVSGKFSEMTCSAMVRQALHVSKVWWHVRYLKTNYYDVEPPKCSTYVHKQESFNVIQQESFQGYGSLHVSLHGSFQSSLLRLCNLFIVLFAVSKGSLC